MAESVTLVETTVFSIMMAKAVATMETNVLATMEEWCWRLWQDDGVDCGESETVAYFCTNEITK